MSPAEAAAERATAFEKAAAEADRRGDIGQPFGPTAGTWLRSLAATERVAAASPATAAPTTDLTPFRQVLEEVRLRGMRFGGGTGEAFRACASLLETAFAQFPRDDL